MMKYFSLNRPASFTNYGSLFRTMNEAASGMYFQTERLSMVSQNLANAGAKAGGPGEKPYQRKIPIAERTYNREKGIHEIKVKEYIDEKTPFDRVLDPSHPGANDEGFVQTANVNTIVEISDMRESARSHEANVRVYERALSMYQDLLSIIKV
jgi:flagellar basal-body rod protein FlgC